MRAARRPGWSWHHPSSSEPSRSAVHWIDTVLLSPRRIRPARAAGVIAATIGVAWLLAYGVGGAGVVPPHWFYLPVFLAGARFGIPGALVAALASTLVSGPLLPLEVADHVAQTTSDWASRGGFFVVIGTAVTVAVVRLQETLETERDVLTEARALAEAKAAIVESVSHEFRTPLTVIKGTTDVLARQVTGSDLQDLVVGLRRSSERLESLVEVVLGIADAVGGHVKAAMTQVDLGRFCTEIAEALHAGSRVQTAAPPGVVVLAVDPRLLRVALRCVIETALNLSPPGEIVHVRVELHGPGVELSVTARGVTVPEVVEQMFEPFSTVERGASAHGERLGLGLFAARAIVEQVGGDVVARPRPAGGTELVVVLPGAREA